MKEAQIRDTETGKVVEGEGWFVLNLGEASWQRDPKNGVWCRIEADDALFADYAFNVHVIEPGQPSALYHSESVQEGFLVLAGECIAIVEGEERRMRQWDYLHCPPDTDHIFVGAGDGPCAIVMTGGRGEGRTVHYPVNEVAARYGASSERETSDPKEAYGERGPRTREPAPPQFG